MNFFIFSRSSLYSAIYYTFFFYYIQLLIEVSLMLYLKDKGPVSRSFYNRIVNIKVPLVALRRMPSTNTIYDTMILDIKLASKIELRLI